eukprot:TRINITY_DN55761_c0_g2_i1.p1 TRINITY_DN55761_c0_g2~~TRINITY_DN55761_c0_g2_i1.p1  ORF type:complete len:154 (-),score=6.72 TRINITY_DN55761_c0_g2_i1:63-524(-)
MKRNMLKFCEVFLVFLWTLGAVIRQAFGQANGNAMQSECQIAIQALETACALEQLDDLASLSIDQFHQCCQYTDSIRTFGCYDPCEVVPSETSSLQYPIWRPLCEHDLEPCTPSHTPMPTPNPYNYVQMKTEKGRPQRTERLAEKDEIKDQNS